MRTDSAAVELRKTIERLSAKLADTRATMRERERETASLYRFSELVEQIDAPVEEVLQAMADRLCSALSDAESTCVGIDLDGRRVRTVGFRATDDGQSHAITVGGRSIGSVETYRLADTPQGFADYERRLIRYCAERAAEFIRRRRADEALRMSEDRFRALFDRAGIGMVAADTQGRIARANPAMQSMLGYSGDELSSLSIADITHPADLHVYHAYFAALSGKKQSAQSREM